MSLSSVSRPPSALLNYHASLPNSRPNTSLGTSKRYKNSTFEATTAIDRPKYKKFFKIFLLIYKSLF